MNAIQNNTSRNAVLNSVKLGSMHAFFGLILLTFFNPAFSADNALLDALNNAEINLDAVEVSGKRTVSNVKKQLDRAQFRQFRLFNKLVVDGEYRIICRKVGRTGTFQRERECRPSFIKQIGRADQSDANSATYTDMRGARSRNYRPIDMLGTMSSLARTSDDQRKFTRLYAMMLEHGAENEELGNLIIRANELRLLYQELVKQNYYDLREKN